MLNWKSPLLVVDQWGPFRGQPPARKAAQVDTADGGTLVALMWGNGGGMPAYLPDGRGGFRAIGVRRPEGAEPYRVFVAYFPPGRGPNTVPDPEAPKSSSRFPTLEEIISAVHYLVPRGTLMGLSPYLAQGSDASVEVDPGNVGLVELRQYTAGQTMHNTRPPEDTGGRPVIVRDPEGGRA